MSVQQYTRSKRYLHIRTPAMHHFSPVQPLLRSVKHYLFQGKQAARFCRRGNLGIPDIPPLLRGTGTCGHQDKQLQGTAVPLAAPPGIKSGLGDMLRHISLNKMTRGRDIKQKSCILTSLSHRGSSPNSPQERTPSAIVQLQDNQDKVQAKALSSLVSEVMWSFCTCCSPAPMNQVYKTQENNT